MAAPRRQRDATLLRMTEPARAWIDPVIEVYKTGVDKTLLVEQLRRGPEERMRRIEALQHAMINLSAAARRGR
jgi:hypothetical protein